ncbi:hypothetical protein ABW20_dc0108169 [Dactylellina cionopaga]|nr:hypothetical protein ABW20_dc0108169 [Dactylellina cionopaga]
MQIKAITLALLTSGPLAVFAANCIDSPGNLGGQCVEFWAGGSGGCNGPKLSYRPDCSGACFHYDSFTGIRVSGDGTYGTNCHIYSDYNCQNQITTTGNTVFRSVCLAKTAKSMKCYYLCNIK